VVAPPLAEVLGETLVFGLVVTPPLADVPVVPEVPVELLLFGLVVVVPLADVPDELVLDVPLFVVLGFVGCVLLLEVFGLAVVPGAGCTDELDPAVAVPLWLGEVVVLGDVVGLLGVVGFDPVVVVGCDDGLLSGPSAKATPPALTIRLEPSSPAAASRSSLSCISPP